MPIRTKSLATTSSDDALRCANCDNDNLHQFVLVVHNRHEDGPTRTLVIHQTGGEDTHGHKHEAFTVPPNPSSRRQGASIGFWCEHCSYHTWLHVEQHKGCTFVGAGWEK